MMFYKILDIVINGIIKTKKMKTITVVFAMFFTCIISAQQTGNTNENIFKNWTLGVKAGGNLSSLFGDVGDDDQAFYGHVHFGGVANRNISEEWAIALEPHISVVGRGLSDGFERITYFNIPVLAVYQLPDNFTLDGGLHLGIKVAETINRGDGGQLGGLTSDRYKRIAPGLTIGSTYKINQNWFAQFRVNYKISDVIRDDAGDTEGTSILVFQLSIGYTLGNNLD